MAGMGAVGGAGGMGGAGGAGGVGGGAGAGASTGAAAMGGTVPASPSSGSTQSTRPAQQAAPEASTTITISKAAMRANSVEPTQPGASFSLTTDKGGHHYAGGTDVNGFSNPQLKPTQTVGSAGKSEGSDGSSTSLDRNVLGQKYSDLNKLDEAIAALLLSLLQKKT